MNNQVIEVMKKDYRVTVTLEYDWELEDIFGSDPEDYGRMAVYLWENGGYNYHVYGSEEGEFTNATRVNGYVQGAAAIVKHNGESEEFLDAVRSALFDGTVKLTLEHWNPDIGVGWECYDSVSMIRYRDNLEDYLVDAQDCFGEHITIDDLIDNRHV